MYGGRGAAAVDLLANDAIFRKSSRKVNMTQNDSLLAFASLHNGQ